MTHRNSQGPQTSAVGVERQPISSDGTTIVGRAGAASGGGKVPQGRVAQATKGQRRVLILGTGAWAARFHEAWRQSAPLGWELVGFVGTMENSRVAPVLNRQGQLLQLVQDTRATDVVLAVEEAPAGVLAAQLLQLLGAGIRIIPVGVFYERLTGRVPAAQISDFWQTILGAISLRRRLYLLMKRCIDVMAAVIGLVPMVVLFLPVALAIKLDSQGPVFDGQERVGQFGRRFRFIKFRTMVENAERTAGGAEPPIQSPHMTHVGHLLRRFGLDKLPLFLNILKGELSLIGPLPELPDVVARLEGEVPFYSARTLLKPGLIGWGLVQYRHDIRCLIDVPRRLEYDLYYIKHVSLTLDLAIAYRVVGTVLGFKNV